MRRWHVIAACALVLVEFHGPTGQVLAINPAEISSVRQPSGVGRHWAKGTRCVLVMTNGRMNAVAEDCATVEKTLVHQQQ